MFVLYNKTLLELKGGETMIYERKFYRDEGEKDSAVERKARIMELIGNIKGVLADGTRTVKEGHRVKGVSDGSVDVEVLLSPTAIATRQRELDRLRRVLEKGESGRGKV